MRCFRRNAFRATIRSVKIAQIMSFSLVSALAGAVSAVACPLCASGLSPGLRSGMLWSTLLMVSIPFGAFATLGFIVYRAYKKDAAHSARMAAGITNTPVADTATPGPTPGPAFPGNPDLAH